MPQPRRHQDNAAKQRAYRARQAQARRDEQQAKGLPACPAAGHPAQPRPLAGAPRAGPASLETARDEMQAYYDDRSEAWQQGERAAALAEQIDQLGVVLDELEALPPC